MRESCVFVAWVFATLILGCGDDPILQSNTTPDDVLPLPGKIVFASDRDGDVEIYLMNADGSLPLQLTENEAIDYPSSCSPDGRELAFVSDRNGYFDIYVMALDGSGLTAQLTEDTANNGRPVWSPDGRRIAFHASRDGDSDSFFTNPHDANFLHPDSRKIGFDARRDGDSEIFAMDSDGGNLIQLTDNDVDDYMSSWSPDGQKIAFTRYPNSIFDGDGEIFLMDADGKNPVQLTNNNTYDRYPAWSPDGQTIAFTSTGTASWIRTGANTHRWHVDTNIYLMNSDGSDVQQLTHDNISGGRLSWSPDGHYITFRYNSKNPNLKSELHIMTANGNQRRTLISWPNSHEGLPIWGRL